MINRRSLLTIAATAPATSTMASSLASSADDAVIALADLWQVLKARLPDLNKSWGPYEIGTPAYERVFAVHDDLEDHMMAVARELRDLQPVSWRARAVRAETLVEAAEHFNPPQVYVNYGPPVDPLPAKFDEAS